jgi:EAL domain-containing protein (putative c-di-GMP-specific phosphodiesterase class I)
VALYNVKSAGRQGFEIYRSGSMQRIEGVRRLETDLRVALRENQFELHYQPVLSLKSHDVVCCEALLRWRHPEYGFIAPEEFLPIAERSGDMLAIGSWVLQQACRDASCWPEAVNVAVNLSLLQLQSGDLPDVVSQALGESGLKTSRLSLEVGEGLLARESNAVRGTLNRLRALGVQLALDDFGKTGGALNMLQSYRFDMIKIDRALIKTMPTQTESAAIVSAICALARSLGILSVAEGIETSEELRCVERAGCTKVQGFYFSRPVPTSELNAALAECPHKFALAA